MHCLPPNMDPPTCGRFLEKAEELQCAPTNDLEQTMQEAASAARQESTESALFTKIRHQLPESGRMDETLRGKEQEHLINGYYAGPPGSCPAPIQTDSHLCSDESSHPPEDASHTFNENEEDELEKLLRALSSFPPLAPQGENFQDESVLSNYCDKDFWMDDENDAFSDFDANSLSDADWSIGDYEAVADGKTCHVVEAHFSTPSSESNTNCGILLEEENHNQLDPELVEWLKSSIGAMQGTSMVHWHSSDIDNDQSAPVNEAAHGYGILVPEECNVIPMEATETCIHQGEDQQAMLEPLPTLQQGADLEEKIPKGTVRAQQGIVTADDRAIRGSAKKPSTKSPRSLDDASVRRNQQVITQDEICDNDVLFGRGSRANMHPGNVRLRALIARTLERYKHPSSTKSAKTKIVKSIVNSIIEERGGRFLRMDINQRCAVTLAPLWVVVSRRSACYKVSQRFREDFRSTKGRKPSHPERHFGAKTAMQRKKSLANHGATAKCALLVAKSPTKKPKTNSAHPDLSSATRQSSDSEGVAKPMNSMEIQGMNRSAKEQPSDINNNNDNNKCKSPTEAPLQKDSVAKAENILCFNEKTNSWFFKNVDDTQSTDVAER